MDSKHCSWLGLQAMEPAPPLPMLLCKVFFFQTLANVRSTLAHMSLVNTLAHALPSVQGFPCQLGFRGLSVQWPLQSSQTIIFIVLLPVASCSCKWSPATISFSKSTSQKMDFIPQRRDRPASASNGSACDLVVPPTRWEPMDLTHHVWC